jgi:trans-aconitate methyltransferase
VGNLPQALPKPLARDFVFTVTESVQFCQALSAPIGKTDEPLKILDLGCGTGLEIESLLQRMPKAPRAVWDLAHETLTYAGN